MGTVQAGVVVRVRHRVAAHQEALESDADGRRGPGYRGDEANLSVKKGFHWQDQSSPIPYTFRTRDHKTLAIQLTKGTTTDPVDVRLDYRDSPSGAGTQFAWA